jgi:hypothetical protein
VEDRDRRLALRLGDYRRVLLSAFALVDHRVALVTVTPPGNADLPPDVDGYRDWNRRAAWLWARMDRRAKGRLRRDGLTLRPLARVAQRQGRGLDHLHLVVLLEHEGDRAALRAYVAHLKELAPLYRFGFVDDPFLARHPKGPDGRPNRALPKRTRVYESASVAGRYLCRYLTESTQLRSMIEAADHSFRALWVAPSLTRASGVNVRRLRRARHAYWVLRAIHQHSRPTLPVWWGDLREKTEILRLLRPAALAAT